RHGPPDRASAGTERAWRGGTPTVPAGLGAGGYRPLFPDLGLLYRAAEVERGAQCLLAAFHVGDDAARELAALRDVRAGAGVERAGGDGHVAHLHGAAVV